VSLIRWRVPDSDLETRIARLAERLTEVRHDLHRHPELGFEERRTQRVVLDTLAGLGLQPRSCAGTGAIVDIGSTAGPRRTLALRADLDALPIHETTRLPYRSVHDGVAHKCGHDGHTTILLGIAHLLRERSDWLRERGARIRLLFQPAEEGVRGGGARVMVAEGALEGVDEVYGLHNWPAFPFGTVRVRAGPVMARTAEFEIEVRGRGGHGSQPQACRDPIVAASALVSALQTIASRNLGAAEPPIVLSVCTFHAGEAVNAIPETAQLAGTLRSFSDGIQARVVERMREIARGIASAYSVEVSVEITPGFPVLVNDETCAEVVRRVAAEALGVSSVSHEGLPMTAAEDFAVFAAERPAAYFFLGAGRSEDTPGCHHPHFDFDDDLLALGMRMFMGIVRDRLDS
jgi:amidohydrolase